MHLPVYLDMLHEAERTLADSFRKVADEHTSDAGIHYRCQNFAEQCDAHVEQLTPLARRYGKDNPEEPERLHPEGISEPRSGPAGLLRDLQDLYMLASLVDITWTLVGQAARAVPDEELIETVTACDDQTETQLSWLRTQLSTDAPQALVVG
ncbi:hypothetical protein [Natrinema sp. 74]|uniref:hypothetical protein n=1 Tax=Natrinema sp. 74 TaxID=3384159 RepID=UPI0038D3B08A